VLQTAHSANCDHYAGVFRLLSSKFRRLRPLQFRHKSRWQGVERLRVSESLRVPLATQLNFKDDPYNCQGPLGF
jgi:hypothetical protein